jgi:bifunctional non-homologous end joining protein LigD
VGKKPGTVCVIGERMIELTSESAVMFPDDRITKGQLVNYYLEVAAVMLPYLEGRPLTVERFTKGIGARGFIQKQASSSYPDWIRRAPVESKRRTVEHVVCDEAATLVYLANQRVVTFHITSTRADRLYHPDQVIFDFDPPDAGPASFDAVRRGAQMVGELLRELDLTPFVKTSGSKGLHVIAPIERSEHIDDVRAFGRTICDLIAARDPQRFTTAMSKQARHGKVFLDYLRNGYAQTVAAPYSVRPIAGAPVSTPITWDELRNSTLHARTFTIAHIKDRLAQTPDPWRGMMAARGSLDAASVALDAML